MITWFTGNSGAGKTTIASKRHGILLDGDELRAVWPGLGLDRESRWEQNRRVARLAALLGAQGYDVNVAVIAPYRELRKELDEIANINWVYVRGGRQPSAEYPYEPPLPEDGYSIIEGAA